MKKVIVVAAVLSLMMVGSAFAAGQAHTNAGCGLGTMIWRDSADNSVSLQTLQLTTNDLGNYFLLSGTFGITSGTSECQQPKNFVSNERATEFMMANMDNLAKDIAQGRGETLDAFAELMQVPAEKRPEFYRSLQSGFMRIYTSHDVQMASVMDNISTVSK
jgi:hypothetical protein